MKRGKWVRAPALVPATCAAQKCMGPCTTGRRPRRRFCSWVQPSDQLWWPEHGSRPGGAPAGGGSAEQRAAEDSQQPFDRPDMRLAAQTVVATASTSGRPAPGAGRPAVGARSAPRRTPGACEDSQHGPKGNAYACRARRGCCRGRRHCHKRRRRRRRRLFPAALCTCPRPPCPGPL